MAAGLGEKMEDAAKLRAYRFGECSRTVSHPACGGCGDWPEAKGELTTTHPCHARACPSCSRARATEKFHELYEAMQGVPKVEGYFWSTVTLTRKRKPRDPASVTIAALTESREALGRQSKHLWDTNIKLSLIHI